MRLTISTSGLALGLLLAGASFAADRVEVGQQVPDVQLESSSGKSYDIGSLSGEKKALLVFYRGTW